MLITSPNTLSSGSGGGYPREACLCSVPVRTQLHRQDHGGYESDEDQSHHHCGEYTGTLPRYRDRDSGWLLKCMLGEKFCSTLGSVEIINYIATVKNIFKLIKLIGRLKLIFVD